MVRQTDRGRSQRAMACGDHSCTLTPQRLELLPPHTRTGGGRLARDTLAIAWELAVSRISTEWAARGPEEGTGAGYKHSSASLTTCGLVGGVAVLWPYVERNGVKADKSGARNLSDL